MHSLTRRSLSLAASTSLSAWYQGQCSNQHEFAQKDRYDVVIIGGGVVGSSLAVNLLSKKNNNVSVAVLEAGSVGCEASGLSAGTIWSAGLQNPKHLNGGEMPVPDVCNEIMGTSSEFYASLQSSGYDCGYVRSGNLIVACTDEEASYLEKTCHHLQQTGYNASFLPSSTSVCAVEPALTGGRAVAALHTPESGYVEPLQATQAVAARAVALGAHLYESQQVVSISTVQASSDSTLGRRHPHRYRLRTRQGLDISARHVVVAAGTGCPALLHPLGIALPVFPVKGSMFETNPVEGRASLGIKSTVYVAESDMAWQALYSSGAATGAGATAASAAFATSVPKYLTHDSASNRIVRHCYGRPRADGTVVFGGSRQHSAAAGAAPALDYSIDPAVLQGVLDQVCEFYPRITTLGTSGGAWSGFMPFSADGAPLVGSLAPLGEQFEGLWVAGGFGPEGIMEGPGATGHLATDILHCLALQTGKGGGAGAEADLHLRTMLHMDPCRRGGATRSSNSDSV